MNNDLLILHLSLIEGVGPAVVDAIVNYQATRGDLAEIYMMSASDFMQMGISDPISRKIVDGLQDLHSLELTCKRIEQYNISWTTVYSEDYPAMLKAIHMPPTILYWQGGDFSQYQKCIAIVGSREANRYGELFINQIVPDLVANDWTIVSGGARGADAMAHEAALHHAGKTIAVLGSGLLRQYPASNRKMFENIIAYGGMVVSSFPLGMDGFPGNFPARNRIISGLSRGCVVVQAAERSGTRITAEYALEQGRDVFAVPGPIGDELSVGCNRLIQEGAKLILNAADILSEYEGVAQMTIHAEEPTIKRIRRQAYTPAVQPLPEPTTIEGIIMRACQRPCSLDDLMEKTGLSMADMHGKLFEMQLEGHLKQDFSGMWLACGSGR